MGFSAEIDSFHIIEISVDPKASSRRAGNQERGTLMAIVSITAAQVNTPILRSRSPRGPSSLVVERDFDSVDGVGPEGCQGLGEPLAHRRLLCPVYDVERPFPLDPFRGRISPVSEEKFYYR